ncbi:hypothetical protein U9M48_041162 [Paspalum notatum var. saurae]|uniref:Uncharacterized protein n=1 Tax=Paspalum notatum var. saurae TaxID=547442 RepID=A0AAQ3UPY2_PASNO
MRSESAPPDGTQLRSPCLKGRSTELVSMRVAFHPAGTRAPSAASATCIATLGATVPSAAMATAFLPDLTIMPRSVFTPMTKIWSMKT